jgi:hypothetical protein
MPNGTVQKRLARDRSKSGTDRETVDARAKQEQERYLKALEAVGTLTAGCKAAKVSANTVYAWREMSETFAMRENQARSTFADTLEAEAVRRARQGTERPVYQQGQLVGYETVYSDALLWNLLRSARPEKYRDRLDLNVSSVVKQVAGFDPADLL